MTDGQDEELADVYTKFVNQEPSMIGDGAFEPDQLEVLKQLEMQKMLNNPEMREYLKTRDPTYVKFRQTIRDREAFNREDDKLKPTD